MTRTRTADPATRPLHRTLNSPGPFLRGMLVFLALVGFLVAIIHKQLLSAFWTNPLLNGLIIGVLLVGIIRAFGQVVRLYPEIRWVNAFRIADPGLQIEHKPVLLAPMATMLRDRRGSLSLSTTSMRSIMDSIGGRLDEARDTGRYLVGLLVFLGLLGTFWGLLETMQSVGKVISTLDSKQTDSVLVFEELKNGLAAPLRGMGTAFSASLLGLAGSLILGFLDLQSSQAQNRFYTDLEDWLASTVREYGDSGAALGGELQHALDRIRTVLEDSGGGRSTTAAMANLAEAIQGLVAHMRTEQQMIREWADGQGEQNREIKKLLERIARHPEKS